MLTDLPSFEEIKAAAGKEFIEWGHDPGVYQGFMAGSKWLCDRLGYKVIAYSGCEWLRAEDAEKFKLPRVAKRGELDEK